MAKQMISTCDGCGKCGDYNPNYKRPNDWIGCIFYCNKKAKEFLDFCSKECLKKYIDSNRMGNDIGHEIKDASLGEHDE